MDSTYTERLMGETEEFRQQVRACTDRENRNLGKSYESRGFSAKKKQSTYPAPNARGFVSAKKASPPTPAARRYQASPTASPRVNLDLAGMLGGSPAPAPASIYAPGYFGPGYFGETARRRRAFEAEEKRRMELAETELLRASPIAVSAQRGLKRLRETPRATPPKKVKRNARGFVSAKKASPPVARSLQPSPSAPPVELSELAEVFVAPSMAPSMYDPKYITSPRSTPPTPYFSPATPYFSPATPYFSPATPVPYLTAQSTFGMPTPTAVKRRAERPDWTGSGETSPNPRLNLFATGMFGKDDFDMS